MALTDKLTAIGNAIREKNGTTDKIPLVDMPQAILDIVSGGGSQYTSIVYNEDDTIDLIEKDGVVHTMSCTYEDDKLIGVTYDGKAVELTYDGDMLVTIGGTAFDMTSVPLAKVEIANANLTVSPIAKATAEIEVSGTVTIIKE